MGGNREHESVYVSQSPESVREWVYASQSPESVRELVYASQSPESMREWVFVSESPESEEYSARSEKSVFRRVSVVSGVRSLSLYLVVICCVSQ
jgi:hypothetical protein